MFRIRIPRNDSHGLQTRVLGSGVLHRILDACEQVGTIKRRRGCQVLLGIAKRADLHQQAARPRQRAPESRTITETRIFAHRLRVTELAGAEESHVPLKVAEVVLNVGHQSGMEPCIQRVQRVRVDGKRERVVAALLGE